MFSQSRTNSPIYILTKGVKPTLEQGIIQSVSQPRPAQFNNQQAYQFPQPMVVDIVATVGNERRNLNGLPSDKTIFDFQQGNMVVTIDKNLVINEVKALTQADEFTIQQYEPAKERLVVYKGMIDALCPEEAEKRRNEEKIQSLEKSLQQQNLINQQMLEQLTNLQKQNEALMGKLDAEKTNKKQKTNETSDN